MDSGLLIGPLVAQTAPSVSVDRVTWVDVVPVVISGLALLISLVFGLRNAGTSQRALALAERQEARRQSRIDVYISDAIAWRHKDGRVVGVQVSLANPADSATSVVHAELHVTYGLEGTFTTVRVRASTAIEPYVPADVVPIELPVRLDANAAAFGWFLFSLPKRITNGRPVERYDIVTRDVHGANEKLQLVLLRETSIGAAPQNHS